MNFPIGVAWNGTNSETLMELQKEKEGERGGGKRGREQEREKYEKQRIFN